MLIVQGGKDLQVARADAEALHAAQPSAELRILADMNHVMKDVSSTDRAANLAAYSDPSLPVDTGLVDAVVQFVTR
jgi:fermentation-respiration switch protein FrsA (DUF1100 family)